MSDVCDKQIRPSARAVIMHKNEILLLKDINDPVECFTLPGGGIEFSESARAALRREVKEEVGVDLVIGRFLGCFEQGFVHWKLGQLHDLALLFLVEISAEQKNSISSQEERYRCSWIAVDKLLQINIVPSELKELIPLWLKQDLDAAFKGSFNEIGEIR